jgi:hypothetical protein
MRRAQPQSAAGPPLSDARDLGPTKTRHADDTVTLRDGDDDREPTARPEQPRDTFGDHRVQTEHAAQQRTPREQDGYAIRDAVHDGLDRLGRGNEEQGVREAALRPGCAARRLGRRRRRRIDTDDQ